MRRLAGRVVCVSVALVLATACRAVPAPPYPLAFALDGRSPRVLQTSEETTVPLVVTNTGQRTWDPERMHVSYHWLWLVPRELARRSRSVPYHDGIRTDLERPVAPGAPLTVQGRLLAPTYPGLYWLQWDMVEEGVTWFAQVAPRQSRTLVVVVPPPAWAFAPLPLVVALCGLYRLRRSTAWVATADVWWCAATLATKPLIVAHDALLEPTAVSYWLILVVALLIPIAAMLILPRRIRPWVLLAIGVLGSLVILGDDVYYRFFGDVLSTSAMLAVNQTARVWGSIRSLFTPGLAWLIVDWPFALWLAVALERRSRRGAAALSLRVRAMVAAVAVGALAVAGLALSAPRVLASTPLDQDVPRPFGRRATRPVRVSPLRHDELRPRAMAAADAHRRTGRGRAVMVRRARAGARGRRVGGLRRRAGQEPHRRAGGIAAGLRRRSSRERARGDAAPAAVDRRQFAVHQRDGPDWRRADVGRRVHDPDIVAAARSRRGRVSVSQAITTSACRGC